MNLRNIFSSVFIVITTSIIIYAAGTLTKLDSGSVITADNWNAMVDEINDLKTLGTGNVPSTAIMAFYSSSCPSGWKPADGTNSTPDLRGQFIRGMNDFGSGTRDDGNENPDTRTLGETEGDAIRNITAGLKDGRSSFLEDSGAIVVNYGETWSSEGAAKAYSLHGRNFTFDTSRVVPTANDNRPKNVSLIFCQKD